MRLLYLGSTDLPQTKARAIQIVHTCHALARAGAEVTLAVGRRGRGGAARALATYGLLPHSRLRLLCLPILRIPPTAPPRVLAQFTRVWQLSYLAGLAAALPFEIIRRRPDVVFARDLRTARLAAGPTHAIGARLVFEVHGLPSYEVAHGAGRANLPPSEAARLRALEDEVFARADRIVTITECARQILIDEYGVDPDRVRTVADGNGPHPPTPRRPSPQPSHPPARGPSAAPPPRLRGRGGRQRTSGGRGGGRAVGVLRGATVPVEGGRAGRGRGGACVRGTGGDRRRPDQLDSGRPRHRRAGRAGSRAWCGRSRRAAWPRTIRPGAERARRRERRAAPIARRAGRQAVHLAAQAVRLHGGGRSDRRVRLASPPRGASTRGERAAGPPGRSGCVRGSRSAPVRRPGAGDSARAAGAGRRRGLQLGCSRTRPARLSGRPGGGRNRRAATRASVSR